MYFYAKTVVIGKKYIYILNDKQLKIYTRNKINQTNGQLKWSLDEKLFDVDLENKENLLKI